MYVFIYFSQALGLRTPVPRIPRQRRPIAPSRAWRTGPGSPRRPPHLGHPLLHPAGPSLASVRRSLALCTPGGAAGPAEQGRCLRQHRRARGVPGAIFDSHERPPGEDTPGLWTPTWAPAARDGGTVPEVPGYALALRCWLGRRSFGFEFEALGVRELSARNTSKYVFSQKNKTKHPNQPHPKPRKPYDTGNSTLLHQEGTSFPIITEETQNHLCWKSRLLNPAVKPALYTPRVPHPHVFEIPPGMVSPPLPGAACFNAPEAFHEEMASLH